jgi:signal peptidase I
VEASELRRRRRARLRRPPRLLRVAALARWPKPLVALLAVALLALGSLAWPPLGWAMALVWGLVAAAAVVDAGLRDRQGIAAGLAGALLGPLGVAVVALARRRAIRKVGDDGMGWTAAFAGVMGVAGAIVALLLLGVEGRYGPHAVDVPRAAMGERIVDGDRVLVVPQGLRPIDRGDVVLVERFAGVDEALGDGARIAGVGRVLGTEGQVIGAIDGLLYLCAEVPDAIEGLTAADRCENPQELSYLQTPTPDFGPIEIPRGTVWVLSDDRAATPIDSRVYGPVPIGAIDGTVVAVLRPLARIGIL